MKNSIKILAILFFALFVSASFAQDSTKSSHHHMNMKEHMNDQKSMDHGMMDNKSMDHHMMDTKNMDHHMMDSTMTDMKDESSIIREGVIDLQAIDENGDGKVFQDMMDWNVISEKAGYCPICEMQLKEVTLEKAKENLLKHNFKVK